MTTKSDCDCGAEPHKDASPCRDEHLPDCPAAHPEPAQPSVVETQQKKSRWLIIGQLVGGAAAFLGGLALIALAGWLVLPM